ncbi:MAG: hypothetical protein M0P00_03635 [Bacteroidaceae bacterium]|nr:hypothetical protein [Bacteroidaceae bacterium]
MMKKLVYIISLFTLVLASCSPMDDIYDEVDKANEQAVADAKFYAARTLFEDNYTMTDADYALSTNTSISKYMNFSASITPAENLAQIFDAKMVYGESGTEYTVSYNYYRGKLSYLSKAVDFVDSVYVMTTNDYKTIDNVNVAKYYDFSYSAKPGDYLPAFLSTKFPNATADTEQLISYNYYDNGLKEIIDRYLFDGTTWTIKEAKITPPVPDGVTIYTLITSDYTSMGAPGSHNNFSSSILPNDYIPTFLGLKYPYAKNGDKVAVIYKYYASKKTTSECMEYTLTDGTWAAYQSTITASSKITFKDKAWAFVKPLKFIESTKAPTVEYTLLKSDYTYADPKMTYGDFYSDDKNIFEEISKILKKNYELDLGQVYKVSYDSYDSTAKTHTILTITLEVVEDAN